jgi:hypothetical protein
MLKNINDLPQEIIRQWINQQNSKVCKLWRTFWFSKATSICFKYNDIDLSTNIANKFRYLTALKLYYNASIDWSIKSLLSLKIVTLIEHNFTRSSNLQHLTNLTSLSLQKNKKITSLKNLTNIIHLNLQNDKGIKDIGIDNLIKLSLDGSSLITNEILMRLTKLQRLTLTRIVLDAQTIISDRSIIHLMNLTHLHIEDSDIITDVSIKKLTNLTNIRIYRLQNVTFASLSLLTNLTTMHLSAQWLIACDFSNLTNLEKLHLYNVTGVLGVMLTHLTKLETLKLVNMNFIENEDIYKLTNLKTMSILHCAMLEKYKIKEKFLDQISFEEIY